MLEKSPRLNWSTQFLTVAYDGACSPNISVRMAWNSNEIIDSVLRHREVGRAKDLSVLLYCDIFLSHFWLQTRTAYRLSWKCFVCVNLHLFSRFHWYYLVKGLHIGHGHTGKMDERKTNLMQLLYIFIVAVLSSTEKRCTVSLTSNVGKSLVLSLCLRKFQ
jgi:hypothetical protein